MACAVYPTTAAYQADVDYEVGELYPKHLLAGTQQCVGPVVSDPPPEYELRFGVQIDRYYNNDADCDGVWSPRPCWKPIADPAKSPTATSVLGRGVHHFEYLHLYGQSSPSGTLRACWFILEPFNQYIDPYITTDSHSGPDGAWTCQQVWPSPLPSVGVRG